MFYKEGQMLYRRAIRTTILLILGAHLLLARPDQKPTVAVQDFAIPR